jgi:small-conductance mechanosensitive channel
MNQAPAQPAAHLTAAEAVDALQAQFEDVDDSIGQAAGNWRAIAADPAQAAAIAARLSALETRREVLRQALEIARREAEKEAVQVDERAAEELLREQVPILDQHAKLGRDLDAAVRRMAGLMRALTQNRAALDDELIRNRRGVLVDLSLQYGKFSDIRRAVESALMLELGRDVWPVEAKFASDVRLETWAPGQIAAETMAEAGRLKAVIQGSELPA